MSNILIFIASLAILVWGADIIIGRSEHLAKHFGLSEFFIGATLVALGTSLPEMAASISASAQGHPQIAVANIIGSNILNITLVLGLVFLVARSVNPHRDFFAKDSSWALFPVFIFILMLSDGVIGRFEGLMMIGLMGAYLLFLIQDAQELLESDGDENTEKDAFNWLQTSIWLLVGFVAVVYGADYLIDSAQRIARQFGVSEWIIGVVMISMGTSMPELVVSIVAARKGKADMAIGNIIGSNMANLSVALGAAALTQPLVLDPMHYLYDIGTLLVAMLMLVFIAANKLYNRAAGITLLIVLGLFLEHLIA